MYIRRGRTQHDFILILGLFCVFVTALGEIFLGSMVFQEQWPGFSASPSSLRYKTVVKKLESVIRQVYRNDSNVKNVQVTDIRQIRQIRQGSAARGLFYAVFRLRFQNGTKSRINKLYSSLSHGRLGNIPVLLDSLTIIGEHHAKINWPAGSYGLPKPTTGCPTNSWKEGYRYHDSENFNNANLKSNGSHFAGEVGSHGIRQEFCIHTHGKNSEEENPWPLGQYCIYKKGKSCPTGLEEGWIRWDDENGDLDHPNSLGGELPEGAYGDNTLIRFCCSTRGNKTNEIILPTGKPFYLLAYGSRECQRVLGYEASSEFLQFDDEDQGNRNAHGLISPYGPVEDPFNTRLYYCYYQPVTCDRTKSPFCDTEEDIKERVHDHGLHAVSFAAGSGVAVVLIGSAAIAYTAKQLLTSANSCDN